MLYSLRIALMAYPSVISATQYIYYPVMIYTTSKKADDLFLCHHVSVLNGCNSLLNNTEDEFVETYWKSTHFFYGIFVLF